MRKRRHHLTETEESALAADIVLSRALTTKELMRKYSASRSLIDSMKRRVPYGAEAPKATPDPPKRETLKTPWKDRRTRSKPYAEMSDEQRRKANTRAYSKSLLARGHLKREPCRDCGANDVEMHHEDYSDPRRVIWLCRPCHLRLHQEEAIKQDAFNQTRDISLGATCA